MATHSHFAALSLARFIDALASQKTVPGAGAAAAVTLALAAACACKAAAITLKHRPGIAALLVGRDRLTAITEQALAGADEDARRFEDVLRSKDEQASARLEVAEVGMRRLAAELMQLLEELDCDIDPVVAGDMRAATALCQAVMAIEAVNLYETRRGDGAGGD